MLASNHRTSDQLLTCGRFIFEIDLIFQFITQQVFPQGMSDCSCNQTYKPRIYLVEELLVMIPTHLWAQKEDIENEDNNLPSFKASRLFL